MIWIGSVEHERLGPIWVAVSPLGIRGLYLQADEQTVRAQWPERQVVVDPGRVAPYLGQIEEYFAGQRRTFDLPIDWSVVTLFQEEVLRLVCAIPYGQTRTYQQLADELGKPGAARAVGQANATNPIPLIIPCHRVLGSDGGLHGYGGAGGVETKAWLLALEGNRLL
jgi:methylated-DNA-[protein]-cysteine S-methyltransferase